MAAQAENSNKSHKPLSRIPTGSSSWDGETLDLLNAKFHMNAETHEGEVIEFPPERPFGIDVQFKIPENVQKRTSPFHVVLRAGIDKVAEAFLKVNNNGILHTRYDFDSDKHPDLKEFVFFYRHLRASLRRREQRNSNRNQVPTKFPTIFWGWHIREGC